MVQPPVDEKSLEGSLKDLKLSTEEVDKFGKAFKDPEFLKMFEEYAREVSDPKVKAETDLYLRQLEKEGRAEETYGKGVQLIAPTPCFVFKTADTNTGEKLFINVCSSEKLEPAARKEEVGPTGKKGLMFQIPLSLGIKRSTTDKKGGAATVVDFVVHPDTIAQAITSKPIMGVLAETAMETIEKAAKVTLNRAFKIPKNMKFKTSEGVDRPPVLSVRTPTAAGGPPSAPGERIRPVSSSQDPAALSQQSPSTDQASAPQGEQQSSTKAVTKASATPAIRSGFSFGKTEKDSLKGGGAGPGVQQDPCQPGFVHPTGEVTPEWTLVHRGTIDLADSWGDAGKGLTAVHAPKELVARFHLPLIASAAAVDLDVSRMKVVLTVPGKYHVVVALPHAVDDDRGKAKFDKAKHTLEVVLPVLPPPRTQPTKQQLAQAAAALQPASHSPSDTDTAVDQTTTSTCVESSAPSNSPPTPSPSLSSQSGHSGSASHASPPTTTSVSHAADEGDVRAWSVSNECESAIQDPPAVSAVSTEIQESVAAPVAGASCRAASTRTSAPLTENERLWQELHKEEEAVVAREPEACKLSSLATEAHTPAVNASSSATAARAALEAVGLAPVQHPANVLLTAQSPRLVPVMQLQPRLTKSLAMDLD